MSDQSLSLNAPIGVFDSGLGGLTVVRQIREALPHESILYIADQAHVPYGGRPLEEVQGFAINISEYLIASGCKAVVMACNISSAVSLKIVQRDHPEIPVLGVILPGAAAAAESTKNGRIGVLATQGTVQSGAYTNAFADIDAKIRVFEVACPLFVPLVESDRCDTLQALEAAETYLKPLIIAGVDTVVLGCTHYPFLLSSLRKISAELNYIDPSVATVKQLARIVTDENLFAPRGSRSRCVLTTTGDVSLFEQQICRFLPASVRISEVIKTDLQSSISPILYSPVSAL